MDEMPKSQLIQANEGCVEVCKKPIKANAQHGFVIEGSNAYSHQKVRLPQTFVRAGNTLFGALYNAATSQTRDANNSKVTMH